MKTYNAKVERDGRFWLVTVVGVGVTQARHLREVQAGASESGKWIYHDILPG